MPYISKERRKALFGESTTDTNTTILSAGELNYYITYIIDEYIRNYGLNYQNINDIIGALEGAKLEFYRRVVSKYEDIKLKQNGEVYDKRSIQRQKRKTKV